MERNTKRIIAIVAIAGIAVGGGVTAWWFLKPLTLPEILALYYEVPGVSTYDPNYVIRMGVLGDLDEIWGDGAYEGAWLAAYEINTAGGIVINNSTDPTTPNGRYYIGVAKDDTDEQTPDLDTSIGITAANRMVYSKLAQFALGGSRTEALAAYLPSILQNKVMFLGTGASDNSFTEHVADPANYPDYEYFFRVMPINSSALGSQIFSTLISYIITLNATYMAMYGHAVDNIGILYENLDWTDALVGNIPTALPYYYNLTYYSYFGYSGIVTVDSSNVIGFDVGSTAATINTYLSNLVDCDIVIPIISGADGIKMVTQWTDNSYPYMLIGIDVQSQASEFWTNTNGKCEYEIQMQAITRTNKTSKSIEFWDNYTTKFGHDPLYTSCGSYDAIYLYTYAINDSQSLNPDNVVASLEKIDKGNPKVGAGGVTAFLSNHDLWAGEYPLGITLFAQWQSGGAKECISAPAYAGYGIETGVMLVPPWVLTYWAANP